MLSGKCQLEFNLFKWLSFSAWFIKTWPLSFLLHKLYFFKYGTHCIILKLHSRRFFLHLQSIARTHQLSQSSQLFTGSQSSQLISDSQSSQLVTDSQSSDSVLSKRFITSPPSQCNSQSPQQPSYWSYWYLKTNLSYTQSFLMSTLIYVYFFGFLQPNFVG